MPPQGDGHEPEKVAHLLVAQSGQEDFGQVVVRQFLEINSQGGQIGLAIESLGQRAGPFLGETVAVQGAAVLALGVASHEILSKKPLTSVREEIANSVLNRHKSVLAIRIWSKWRVTKNAFSIRLSMLHGVQSTDDAFFSAK
jgi:hypothetical protein